MYVMFDYVWLICLFFSFWLNSLQQALDSFTSLWLTQIQSFVLVSNNLLYICTQLLSLFIYCWTSRLFPCPGYCKKYCNVNWATCDFLNYGFLRYMPSSGIAGRFILSLLRNIHTVFQNGYINLHPHQQCRRVPHPLYCLLFIYLLNLFIFNWRIIALQNFVVFRQTSTRINHKYTYVPSLLNLPPNSLPIPPL